MGWPNSFTHLDEKITVTIFFHNFTVKKTIRKFG